MAGYVAKEVFVQESSFDTVVEGSKFWITVCAMIASLMAILDISIVNVALTDIRASFGVQLDQIAWISTGYMMANVIVIPMTGWFQQKFGLLNYFAFSLILFTAASVLCGLSWNLFSMTLFRILQGAGGGAIIPTASTILMSRYPQNQQGMAQAFIGLGAITGPLLGPTLGGYLIDWFSWHMIFLINLPIGIVCLFIAMRSIKIPNFKPSAPPLDIIACVLLVVGMASLQFVLEEGSRLGWMSNHLIVFLSAVCVISSVTLVVYQLESKHPIIDFRVFANINYLFCTGLNFVVGITLFSAAFLFSMFCGMVMKLQPLAIGLIFLKGASIQLIVMPLVGALVGKISRKLLMTFGAAMMGLSLYLNAGVTSTVPSSYMILILFFRSLGLGALFIPLSHLAFTNISGKNLGNAVGLFNLTRELGGSIGLAWMASMLMSRMHINETFLRSHVKQGSLPTVTQLHQMLHVYFGRSWYPSGASYQMIQDRISLQALVRSFNYSLTVLLFLFLIAFSTIFFLKGEDKNQKDAALPPLH